MKKIITTIVLLVTLGFTLVNPDKTSAQQWAQCPDGASIVRCETYDCPNGDTNKDGTCTRDDQGARLTDSRSDAFCANPLSGCGEVRYYKQDGTSACSVRVKETGNNCDLYNAGSPNFTPVPTIQATSTGTPRATVTPSPSSKGGIGGGATATPSASPTTKGGEELPKTGPELFWGLAIAAIGFTGIFLREKFSKS